MGPTTARLRRAWPTSPGPAPTAQPDTVECGERHPHRNRLIGGADKRADDDVFEHSHTGKGSHHLKGAANAKPAHLIRLPSYEWDAGETDRAAIGR
jgi:hypothetical protein